MSSKNLQDYVMYRIERKKEAQEKKSNGKKHLR